MFYDIETGLLDWLKNTFPALADGSGVDDHVGTTAPADLQERMPFVRAERIGGPGTMMEDFPTVEVEVFDSDRASAYALAEAIRAALFSPLLHLAGVRIDNVDNDIGPRRLPWEAAGTVRISATYSFIVRRR